MFCKKYLFQFLFGLLLVLMSNNPVKGQEGEYFFPEWMVNEFIAQGLPLWVYMYPNSSGEYNAVINGNEFYWFYEADNVGNVYTRFNVPDYSIYFTGTNAQYAQYVQTINWIGIYGVYPGRGATASSSLIGSSIEDLNAIVFKDNYPKNQSKYFTTGIEYETSEYATQKITALTVPLHYVKAIDAFTNLRMSGRINYVSTSDAKKSTYNISPIYSRSMNDKIDYGGILNISMTKTSIARFSVPDIYIIGAGAFVKYNKYFGRMRSEMAVLIQPKYGDENFNVPTVAGIKASFPVGNYNKIFCEYTYGTDIGGPSEPINFGLLNFKFNIMGLYTLGYKKNIGDDNYKNSIFYLNYRKVF